MALRPSIETNDAHGNIVPAENENGSATPGPATGCEDAMSDPIIGLIIALGFAVYLITTLVRPEKL